MFGPHYQPKNQRGFVNSPQVNKVVIDAILFNKIFFNTGADFVLHSLTKTNKRNQFEILTATLP